MTDGTSGGSDAARSASRVDAAVTDWERARYFERI